MYYKKDDEIIVITDEHKLDGVSKDEIGIYQESVDNEDISLAICKVLFANDKVVYIPEVSINHSDPEKAAEMLALVDKQAEDYAKENGIELPVVKNLTETATTAKPTRYNRGEIEVWDAIRLLGLDYLQGNVVKYTARYKDKNGVEDLKKAVNYLLKMISVETGEDYYDMRHQSVSELLDD